MLSAKYGLNLDTSSFENSVDPDQLASEEPSWSGASLFSIQSGVHGNKCIYATRRQTD